MAVCEATVVTSRGTLAPERNDNRETVILGCKPSGRRAGLRRSAPNSRNRRACPAFSPANTGALMLLALLICSCVPTTIDTVPLQQASLAPLQSETVSSGGYRLQTLPIGEKAPDLLVIVAMSGGGKRSAAYSYGALKGMREVAVPGVYGQHSLLSSLDAISASRAGALPRPITAFTAMSLSAVTKPMSFTRTPMAKSSPSTLRPGTGDGPSIRT